MMRLTWLADDDPGAPFPAVEEALVEPDGLLAAGGDLSPTRLLDAYRRGIFPWYSDGEPILWWSPDPRTVIHPARLKVSRRLARTLRGDRFQVSHDRAFGAVVEACARPRRPGDGTWILPEMVDAYVELHRLGHAHSIEIWHRGVLAGGIYGVAVGPVFCGESMFSRVADASKAAMAHLCRHLAGLPGGLLDCQVASPHLLRMGAETMPRREFVTRLAAGRDTPFAWP